MKLKLKLKQLASLGITLITYGSLTAGASGAIAVTGNPQTGATVQVTSPITWTITTAGTFSVLILDDAMLTPDGNQSVATIVGSLSFTNLNTASTTTMNFFADGNVAQNAASSEDSYFTGSTSGLFGSVGDVIQLSVTAPINFSDANFDLDWQDFSFTGDTFLTSGSGERLSTIVPIPEPSSVLLLGLGALGLVGRRVRK